MSHAEKKDIMERLEGQNGRKRRALQELGVARSSYYRWRYRKN